MKFYTNVQKVGNKIFVVGYDDNGNKVQTKIPFKPSLYSVSSKKEKYKTLDGRFAKRHDFNDIYSAIDFSKKYKDVSGFEIHGDINYQYQYLSATYPKLVPYTSSKIRVANIDIEVTVMDENGVKGRGFPHADEAKYPITAISIYDNIDDVMYTWGIGEWDNANDYLQESESDKELISKIKYINCNDETTLLKMFLFHWMNKQYDVITGWNITGFDIPYITNRFTHLFGSSLTKNLSPWKIVRENNTKDSFGNYAVGYDWVGIAVLDYIELYKKHTFITRDNYKLDNIGFVELGDRKLSYDEVGSLNELYFQNRPKFLAYNAKDVWIVKRLDDKLKLLELVYSIAYDVKANFVDTFSPVKTWDVKIYNHLLSKNIVIPPHIHKKKEEFIGAYVKEPILGKKKYIISFDLASLYPSIIRQWNISPETLVNEIDMPNIKFPINDIQTFIDKELDLSCLPSSNMCVTPNRQFFKTDKQGMLPYLMEQLYVDRKKAKKMSHDFWEKSKNEIDPIKKKYYKEQSDIFHVMDLVKKVLLNALYGATGTPYFRYYDLKIAEAITSSGQLAIKWIEKKVNTYMNSALSTEKDYVVAIDTDSIYLDFEGIVDKFFHSQKGTPQIIDSLNKLCEKKFEPFIGKSYQELCDYVNGREQLMIMDREAISTGAFWVAKKKYAMLVNDMEGKRYDFNNPEIKIMGLETQRSSTPLIYRDNLKKAIRIVLGGKEKELVDFIEEFKDISDSTSMDEVSFPRGVNNLEKFSDPVHIYTKGTPIHVRASLLFNHYIKHYNIEHKYQPILSGDKIRFVFLRVPNPFLENVIAFADLGLPKEFKLDRYVDKATVYDKGFFQPIKNIADKIGWKTDNNKKITDFF